MSFRDPYLVYLIIFNVFWDNHFILFYKAMKHFIAGIIVNDVFFLVDFSTIKNASAFYYALRLYFLSALAGSGIEKKKVKVLVLSRWITLQALLFALGALKLSLFLLSS